MQLNYFHGHDMQIYFEILPQEISCTSQKILFMANMMV